MKKHISILTVFLIVGMQSITAQTPPPVSSLTQTHPNSVLGDPIKPEKPSGYTIAEAKSLGVGSDQLSQNWRNELLRKVNAGLIAANETLRVDQYNVYWILDNTTYEYRELPAGFTNTRRFGSTIETFSDEDGYKGMVAVFRYGKCEIILYKVVCLNLVEVPQKPTNQQPPSTTTAVAAVTPTGGITINNYNVISNSANNDNANSNSATNAGQSGTPYVMGGQQPIYPRQGIFDGLRVNLSFGNGGGGGWTTPVIEPRTGAPGVPGTNGSNPGVPGNPRTGAFGVRGR